MFFKEICKPRLSDFDRTGRLSYEAVLQLLETVAAHQAESVNDSILRGSREGSTWIFVDWRVAICRRPETEEALEVITWARERTAAAAVFRDFAVTGEDGEEILRAEAKFARLNLQTGRLERITDELYAAYQPESRAVFPETAAKLRVPEAYQEEIPLSLRRSDLDYNGHVHNTRYLELALEALPAGTELKEFRLLYAKPLTEGDAVTVKYTHNGGICTVGIYGGEILSTLAEFKY